MAPSMSTDIEVAEFAGQLFFRLWRASHTRTAERLDSIGLTPALFALLNVLGAREWAIQQQLSSDMGIDPSAMVKLINELEDAGLAKRQRRPGDRRAWEVSITPKGEPTRLGAITATVSDDGATLDLEGDPHALRLDSGRQYLVDAIGADTGRHRIGFP